MRREALERSQQCRDDYMVSISELQDPQNQLCSLDESAANEHTCHRKHGWSLFGITPRVIRPVKCIALCILAHDLAERLWLKTREIQLSLL